MSGYIILLLLVMVGMVILAHEMGKQVGQEHGYVRARMESAKCPDCRVLAARASIHMQHDR